MRRFVCTLAAALALAAPASAESVLKVSLHSDLKIVARGSGRSQLGSSLKTAMRTGRSRIDGGATR